MSVGVNDVHTKKLFVIFTWVANCDVITPFHYKALFLYICFGFVCNLLSFMYLMIRGASTGTKTH